MIVLITSLTPRVTLSHTAIPAQSAPTTMATDQGDGDPQKPGQRVHEAAPASAAAIIAAIRY